MPSVRVFLFSCFDPRHVPRSPNFILKKAALTSLQVIITVGILWLVFRDAEKRHKMQEALGKADTLWLLAGFGAYGIVEILAGVRWQLLLLVQGVRLKWSRVFGLSMIGIFFNFFVPGGTGGDVVKIFYLLKETPGKGPQAFLSVLVDRIIGLFSLMALSGVFIALRWDWLMSTPETSHYVWIGLAILGFSFFGITSSFAATGFGLMGRLPAKMPGREKIAEMALAYNSYARAWRTSLAAFAIGIAAHLCYFLTFFCAAKAFETAVTRVPTFYDLCSIMPIVNTITAMPVSFGGVGLREKLIESFFNLTRTPNAVAVVISLGGYILTLLWGLVGGVLYIFYRPSDHSRLSTMKAEVAEFEHEVAEAEIALEKMQ